MAKVIKIKSSCGGQGCDIKEYILPIGIVKEIKNTSTKKKVA